MSLETVIKRTYIRLRLFIYFHNFIPVNSLNKIRQESCSRYFTTVAVMRRNLAVGYIRLRRLMG